MRIPIATSLHVEKFTAGVIDIAVSKTKNVVFDQRPDGSLYATQRPSVNIFEDASDTVSDVNGRGIYYWDDLSARYIVNADTVYKGDYSAAVTNSMSSGTDRVFMDVVNDKLVIIDAENNEGWYIDDGASTTLTEITDTDFPPKQTPALTLSKGGAVLNDTLYVGATNGEIWNSAVSDPTTWFGTYFISAEVAQDGLVAIYKHVDHIAAFGNRTIEFFYDNANLSGSPLLPRQGIVHNVGMADHNTAWVEADATYFVGISPSGDLGVYLLNNFQLSKVSEPDIDSMITTAVISDDVELVGSGFQSGGRAFYLLTFYNISSSVMYPAATLCYDASSGFWGVWELMHTGIDEFPLIDWTPSSGTRAGNGVLSNGDIITVVDNFTPVDTVEESAYIADGYIDDGYYVSFEGSGTNIEMEVITGQLDGGTRDKKHIRRLRAVCTPTTASQTLTVQWSDESNNDYNTGRTLDLQKNSSRITRCGSFRSRNHKLTYSGSEQIELEALEADINA